MKTYTLLHVLLFATLPAVAADLEWVNVAENNKGFALAETGKRFVPWGSHGDDDGNGKLLKDYRVDQGPTVESTVESTVRDMQGFGATTIPEAITLSWLEIFQEETPQILSPFGDVTCEGTYPHHLQGICVDEDAIYWCFTTTLVKTDLTGKLLKKVPVANHHGDLCCQDGRLYVAVNLGKFNDPKGNANSWVYVYDADTLSEIARHEVQEVIHGAGGIGFRDGHFFVVGGLPEGVEENYVCEYDGQFRFVKTHVITSGHTHLGIQTATFADDRWWFGCYGDPKILLVTDADFRMKGRFEFDCSLGIEKLSEGRLLSASGRCHKEKGCMGNVKLAVPDDKSGLRFVDDKGKSAPNAQ